MNAATPITVLLVDDHRIVREGLRMLMEHEPDLEVIGEAATGRQAVDMARKLSPAVVVMDIAMPQLNGMEATRQIHKECPLAKVIVLSAHSDDAYVEHVTELGAAGYLIKQTSAQFLVEAIHAFHAGNTFFSPSIAKQRQKHKTHALDRKGRPKSNAAKLSVREVEVLQLVAEGYANKQIAAELGISAKTVEKHRDNLMQKLDVHETAGLTRYAIASGIIENSVQFTMI